DTEDDPPSQRHVHDRARGQELAGAAVPGSDAEFGDMAIRLDDEDPVAVGGSRIDGAALEITGGVLVGDMAKCAGRQHRTDHRDRLWALREMEAIAMRDLAVPVAQAHFEPPHIAFDRNPTRRRKTLDPAVHCFRTHRDSRWRVAPL